MINARIVDLTLPFRDGTRGFARQSAKTIAADGFNTTDLFIYSHAGTHMDAPRHFLPDAAAIDQWNLELCIGPALVINLAHKAPESLIDVADLAPSANRIVPGTRVLFRTDWGNYADHADYRTRFPRITPTLAQWLTERGVCLIGLETPSVASLLPEHHRELREVHQILLQAGVVIVESLINLQMLRSDTVQFIALPLKIEGCDGSPVRAIAVEYEG